MMAGGSPATTRKAVFALRQCLEAAMADDRLGANSAERVPLPTEREKTARYLSQPEVERLVAELPRQYQALSSRCLRWPAVGRGSRAAEARY